HGVSRGPSTISTRALTFSRIRSLRALIWVALSAQLAGLERLDLKGAIVRRVVDRPRPARQSGAGLAAFHPGLQQLGERIAVRASAVDDLHVHVGQDARHHAASFSVVTPSAASFSPTQAMACSMVSFISGSMRSTRSGRRSWLLCI